MASGLMKLVLSLTGRDDGARRLLAETERQLKRTTEAQAQRARSGKSYELLGVRSEKAIQRELRLTDAAYKRLRASGTASQNDLARAAAAHKQKVAELNRELGKGQKMQKAMNGGATAMAAGTASYAVLSPQIERQKALDMRLRETTWAAHGEARGADAQWLETVGMNQSRAQVEALVRANGGSTDLAIDTIQGMLANGMSWDAVMKDSASTHRLALAAGENGQYDGAAAAKLAKVFADNGLDVNRASQMAAQSGMQGTFEIADMVRELPSLLPDAKAAGFSGEAGFAYLLSSLQSASNKAGSTSEAANNIKNALQKALSADTTKRMDKLASANGSGQDWQKMVLEGQKDGKNAMQVLGEFAQKLLAADKGFQDAKKRADGGDDAAKQEMETMQAFMISKLLPDMQARGGLNAMIDGKQMSEYYNGLMGNKTDVIGGKVAFMNNGFAARQEKDSAIKDIELSKSSTFESLMEAETQFKSLAAQFPVATTALQALAAAASAAALAQGVMGALGAGGGGIAGAGGALGAGLRFGAVGVAGAVGGYGIYDSNKRINRNEGRGFFEGGLDSRAAGYAESAMSSAAVGAAVGSIIPGIGTAIGAAIGGAGGLIHALIADNWSESAPPKPAGMAQGQPVPDNIVPALNEQTASQQAAIAAQTAAYQTAISADTAAVTGGLGAIQAAIASATQTINNNISVNLDGRVIANQVASYQVGMFGRGVGQ